MTLGVIVGSVAIVISLTALIVAIFQVRDARNQERAWRRIAEARRESAKHRREVEFADADFDDDALDIANDSDDIYDDDYYEDDELLSSEQLDERWGSVAKTSQSTILVKLILLERSAVSYLNQSVGVRDWQLFDIRAQLLLQGVWDSDDVAAFDRAMTIRNAVVHGSVLERTPSTSDVSRDLDRLAAKIDASGN